MDKHDVLYDLQHSFRDKKGHAKLSLPYQSRILQGVQVMGTRYTLYCWAQLIKN